MVRGLQGDRRFEMVYEALCLASLSKHLVSSGPGMRQTLGPRAEQDGPPLPSALERWGREP